MDRASPMYAGETDVFLKSFIVWVTKLTVSFTKLPFFVLSVFTFSKPFGVSNKIEKRVQRFPIDSLLSHRNSLSHFHSQWVEMDRI